MFAPEFFQTRAGENSRNLTESKMQKKSMGPPFANSYPTCLQLISNLHPLTPCSGAASSGLIALSFGRIAYV
jgi:hypothetical protein